MKRTGLAAKKSRSNGWSKRRVSGGHRFAVCVKNDDFPASLEPRKIYEVVEDEEALRRRFVRIVDESGEDYLYPQDYFVPIQLSKQQLEAMRMAS